ncbi:MAG: trigger factor [Alphaproteobacteria bacterium]|nr:trigger factor [Alphaproteobacteria bacterium]MCB9695795.1 trigger factor [Alphaproteobacteria bacterium]
MKVDVTEVSSYQKRISFEIPPSEVATKLDAEYKRLGKRARIAGFRPGKAPRRVLEARYGSEVEAQVANDLINRSYQNALKSHSIEAVGQPALQEANGVADRSGFKFTIQVDVRPTITLDKWMGVDVVYPAVEVADAEIEQAMSSRAEARARLEEVTRACEKGDLALVEVEVKDGDETIAHEPGTMIRTAGDPYFPGIEDFVVGMSTGEEKSGKVTFGKDARTENIGDRELDVRVKVLSIQATTVPALDDALAGDLGYEGGLSGMRSAIEAQIRGSRDEMARNQARANLLEALIGANKFEVPASMVENSLRMLMEELRHQQALRTGRDPRTIGFNEAQVRDLRVRAEFAAKAGLILEWVSNHESIKVEDADLDRKYTELANQRGQTLEAVRGWFQKEDAIGELKDRILEEKTLDWLLERANLVTAEAPAAEAPEAEEKPKKKASSKKKADAEVEAAPAEAPAAEEKPKKKASSKKKAEVEAAPAEAAAEEEPKKPARKRSTKKAADAAESEG